MAKRYGFFGLMTLIFIALDQWTKRLACDFLKGNGPVVILEGVFELFYSENRGAAFGILQGKHWFFLLVAGTVVAVIILFLYKIPEGKRYLPLYYCLILLVAGAIGNMIDRFVQGYVVDFLYFSLIDFPIFNVADCYVVVSAVLLVLLTGFFYQEDELNFFGRKEK